MVKNQMGVWFHLSCQIWCICMNEVSKSKHERATFFPDYSSLRPPEKVNFSMAYFFRNVQRLKKGGGRKNKYLFLVLSKSPGNSWLVFVFLFFMWLTISHFISFLFANSVWWLVYTEKWNMQRIHRFLCHSVSKMCFQIKELSKEIISTLIHPTIF